MELELEWRELDRRNTVDMAGKNELEEEHEGHDGRWAPVHRPRDEDQIVAAPVELRGHRLADSVRRPGHLRSQAAARFIERQRAGGGRDGMAGRKRRRRSPPPSSRRPSPSGRRTA